MKPYPIHTCHFFNIFLHQEYILSNKNANLTLVKCADNAKAILTNPIGNSNCTPGFRVCLQTKPNHRYFLEVDAVLTDGKDAFVYIENNDGTRIVERIYRFPSCERNYYGITFEAISNKTFVGILFFCGDIKNVLQINQFRIAPYIDIDNFINEDERYKND